MDEQFNLFGPPDTSAEVARLEKHRKQKPRARTTDPASSHAAAERMRRSGKGARHRERLADIVFTHYSKATGGVTAAEAAKLADDPEIDRYEANRRLPECKDLQQGTARKCRVLGSSCVTWEPKR